MLKICHTCSYGMLGVVASGSVPCRADPQKRDIIEMQVHGCPMDFFRTRAEEANLIAAGYDPVKHGERGKCGC